MQPVNFRDVGHALSLWLDPSPIPVGRLLRGGRLDALSIASDFGNPATILNLRQGPDSHRPGVRMVHVPAPDRVENYQTRLRPVSRWVRDALAALASPELAWPVYVHCTSGRDRTGVVVAAALLAIGVPRAVIVGEYALSDGGDPALIECALDGLSDMPFDDVARLRHALCGSP